MNALKPSVEPVVSGSDVAMFERLFEQHSRAIYNYVFRRVGDWSVAEDLTSVVFLEAFRRRGAVDLVNEPLPWLYGVATNVVHNQRRSMRRHRAALDRVPRPRSGEDPTDELVARMDDQQRMVEIRERLGGLSLGERDVVALCIWQDLSYEQAAQALGIPIGTVRSRLSRARARLDEGAPS